MTFDTIRQMLLRNLDLVMYLALLATTYFIVNYYKRRALEQLERDIGGKPSAPSGEDDGDGVARARLSAITGVEPGRVEAPTLTPEPSPLAILESTLGGAEAAAARGGDQPAVLTQYTAGDGQGVTEIEKMLEKDPQNLQLLDWLAFMYYSNNEVEKAITTYSRIIVIDPDNASQHYYLANSFYKVNRVDEALEHWNRVVEIKPDGKLAKKAMDRIRKVEAAISS